MNTGVLSRGEGRSIWLAGDRYTIKTSGRDSGGAFTLIEALVPPGGGPPPHIHSREDEAFYVLDGEVTFHADGNSFKATDGAWITLARGSRHHFRNDGSTLAHMLILASPAGIDEYFLEAGTPAEAGHTQPVLPTPEEIARLIALAPKYGVEIFAPPHQP
jgi:quercetin dioxygenase-like cupin family protein